MSKKKVLSVRQVAERWGVSLPTVYARIRSGALKAEPKPLGQKLGTMITLAEVRRYEQSLRAGAV